jgi:predicted  nucleic acid-binding Zn-ribbon protein
MTVLPRTRDELEHALVDAGGRIESLEAENADLEDRLAEAWAERDEAEAAQVRLEKRVAELTRAVEGVRDAVARV